MSFDEVVPKLKALLRKKITDHDHKCIFDAPKFLDEIIKEFPLLKRPFITAGLALKQDMKAKIIKSINDSVDTLVMYCQMEYEPGQIEAATNNMADLIFNNIVEELNDSDITDKWGMYKENHHKGGRRGKSILRRTRKQKGLRKRRGKKSRRNKRSSRM